ncbi:UNVERIFIED_CONTAM: hypothetical protein BEN50_23265 [Euhalothece sp. KZN 001]
MGSVTGEVTHRSAAREQPRADPWGCGLIARGVLIGAVAVLLPRWSVIRCGAMVIASACTATVRLAGGVAEATVEIDAATAVASGGIWDGTVSNRPTHAAETSPTASAVCTRSIGGPSMPPVVRHPV